MSSSLSGRKFGQPEVGPMHISQTTITLTPFKRGCHLITREIQKHLEPFLEWYDVGTLHLFIQHTSASLTINENADKDVRADMETWMNSAVSEKTNWKHDAEGSDDMPAHVKSSVFGCSVTVPITGGKLNLGTWQGIWLNEHRNDGGERRLVVSHESMALTFSRSI